MAELEPQYASDYDDRTTVAVKSVLVEIGQVLGSYQGKFAVIGGAVPWLLLNEADMPHVGTLDVDLSLKAEALGDGEYAQLVESLLNQGYHQREHLSRFQLVRTVPARDGGADIDVVIDFLMPRDAVIASNVPPLAGQLRRAARRWRRPCLAVLSARRDRRRYARWRRQSGPNRCRVHSRSTGHEGLRHRQSAQAKRRVRYLLLHPELSRRRGRPRSGVAAAPKVDEARTGYLHISEKFRHVNDFGPTSVRQFVDRTDLLGERTADQWQQDAFGQVDAWLRRSA